MRVPGHASVIAGLVPAHGRVQHQLLIVVRLTDAAAGAPGPDDAAVSAATAAATAAAAGLLLRSRLSLLRRVPGDDPVVRASYVPPLERGLGSAVGVTKHLFRYVALADVHHRFRNVHVAGRVYTTEQREEVIEEVTTSISRARIQRKGEAKGAFALPPLQPM